PCKSWDVDENKGNLIPWTFVQFIPQDSSQIFMIGQFCQFILIGKIGEFPVFGIQKMDHQERCKIQHDEHHSNASVQFFYRVSGVFKRYTDDKVSGILSVDIDRFVDIKIILRLDALKESDSYGIV